MNIKPADFLPLPFLERVEKIIPPAKLDQSLLSFSLKKSVTLRANTLKITPEQLIADLSRLGFELEQVSMVKNAFFLKNRSQKELSETDLYKNGAFYLQNLSSMLPPLILEPEPEDSILDIAAAPGSKTTQIAALMGNKGKIIANDISRIRLYRLEANLRIQGVTNTSISRIPGQQLWKRYPEYFDKSLVDAPCSLEGTFSYADQKSIQSWSVKKIKTLVQEQRYLLRSAVSATKPGGIIVYSTCTLSPEENEGVIDWILRNEKDSLKILPSSFSLDNLAPAVLSWNKKTFDPQIKNCLRVLPSEKMEGFFVAKILKLKSTLSLP